MSPFIHAAAERTQARSAWRSGPVRHPALVLTTTIFASSLAFTDGSVVNVALVAIGRNLTADAAELQWVIDAYLLPLSALLLLGGGAGDRFGRRRYLLAGIALFALASLGCALAPDLRSLIAARLGQGIGAAMLLPNSLAILGQSFAPETEGRAVGIWSAAGAAAGAVGPVLGGWLIDLGSWRAIFLINLPLAGAAIALGWHCLPPDPPRHGEPLDLAGGALATAALGALTWALTIGSGATGWTAPAVAALALAALSLAGFTVLEHRRGPRAMMPVALFGTANFIGLSLLTLLLYAALGELLVLLPYFLIDAVHYSALAAGAALLPLPVIIAVVSPLAGAMAPRFGARALLLLGSLLVAVGFVLALRIGAHAPFWAAVFPAVCLVSLGMAVAVTPLTTAVLSCVDASHEGVASGLNSALARIGGLIATALLGAVLAAQGSVLVMQFHQALLAGAVACVGSALSALLIDRTVLVRADRR